MKAILEKLFTQGRLEASEAESAMHAFLRGTAGPEAIAAFLGALAARGVTDEELLGLARGARAEAVTLPVSESLRARLLDTCGTGGDGASTFNISTAAAFVLAGAGVPVAKHGNRAVSSRSGSADVLEALGVPVDLTPEQAAAALERHGYAFLFAPLYHPGFRHVGPVRKALGVRTVFNFLGPALNPALVRRQVIGVSDARLLEPLARLVTGLGVERAWVVRGLDGLDELTTTAPTEVMQCAAGRWTAATLDARDWGLPRAKLEDLRGGDARENAASIEAILQGEPGPRRDIVLWNAAAALVVAERARDLGEGLALARASIDAGAARRVLEALRGAGAGVGVGN
jgi:anthranilate phosphoribosyltransferase